ncbi:MAG: hypothetical protein P8P74_13235 [Crocinitomicaceae bacterium]|nr:hypothetical protein [Crocinitomicaceae bacterium]
MNKILSNSLRFVLLMVIQVVVLNQVELGAGTLLMIYPLFIVLLPVDMNVFLLLFLAFALGISIDAMSNTYGLHASSLVLMAYFRPIIFQAFAPRDGYEIDLEPNIHTMGYRWTIRTFGLLLLMHHFWFFLLELFRFDEILYVLQKTLLSLPISFALCVLIQFLIIRKPTKGA